MSAVLERVIPIRKITEEIDKITLITPEYMRAVLPAPKSVKIELTGRCNLRCTFCALTLRKEQPKVDMDFEFFKRITREMRTAGVEEIGVFYIGESFMAPKLLVEAITYLKEDLDMPKVFLTSNAVLASPEHVEAVMRAGLDSLKWSVTAADANQYEIVTQTKAKSFHMARSNIKAAWDIRNRNGYRTGLYASSIKFDGAQGAKMEKMLDEHIRPYVDEHYWLPLYTFGSLAIANEKKLGFQPTPGNMGRLGNLREPLPCWNAFTEGHVTWDGKLSACGFDADGYWTMANLNSVDFMTGWNSPEFVALREAHLRKDVAGTACETCALYK